MVRGCIALSNPGGWGKRRDENGDVILDHETTPWPENPHQLIHFDIDPTNSESGRHVVLSFAESDGSC